MAMACSRDFKSQYANGWKKLNRTPQNWRCNVLRYLIPSTAGSTEIVTTKKQFSSDFVKERTEWAGTLRENVRTLKKITGSATLKRQECYYATHAKYYATPVTYHQQNRKNEQTEFYKKCFGKEIVLKECRLLPLMKITNICEITVISLNYWQFTQHDSNLGLTGWSSTNFVALEVFDLLRIRKI